MKERERERAEGCSVWSTTVNYLFNNSFGFDTLTVNACFEEGRPGGFVAATKSLAIENLNNLGIYVRPSLIFNFSIINSDFEYQKNTYGAPSFEQYPTPTIKSSVRRAKVT